MSTNSISSLLAQITDANLRAELSRAVEEALREKKFGLVFEEHLSEVQVLTGVRIRKGTRVSLQGEPLNCTYRVESLETRGKTRWATLRREGGIEGKIETKEANLDSLIPVARYGEAIYPSLKPMERVERAPDKPFHSIINADNYHALQLLLYGYKGAFDVIYIDPPYNTGARDWKYNNDYIDKNDRFRHSKWLSMMKKRLLLAKEMLAKDGVLIVAIDENELHHLLCFLESLFPSKKITTVTVEHNPKGSPGKNFTYSNEFAIFVLPRELSVLGTEAQETSDTRNLRRAGRASLRKERKQSFYPIYVKDGKIKRVGSWVEDKDWHPKARNIQLKSGETEIWPIDNEGKERRWNFGLDTILENAERIEVRQTTTDIQLYVSRESLRYKTVWTGGELDAGKYGTTLVKDIVEREFPFPKSIYNVRRCLSAIVGHKPDALILDFFAGSGTTLHATLLLNAEDDGNRRCVLVTNNEVSEAEEKALLKKKLKPGDEEWELEGICRAVTIPRCKYVINGKRDDGTPLSGKYLNGRELKDGFEANLQAFSLDFLDPLDVSRGGKFEDIAPILWLLAGARGDLISDKDIADKTQPFIWPKGSAFWISRDDWRFGDVLDALRVLEEEQRAQLQHIFLVTNSREAWLEWREAIREIASHIEVHQLYRDYLENYRLGENRLLMDESLVSGLEEAETA